MLLGALASISFPANAQASKIKQKAANSEEINTYVKTSIAAFCKARELKIDLQKSMAVAVATQGYPIFAKHGGLVSGSAKPLGEKQFINNAVRMIMIGSLQGCPKMIPADEKARFEKVMEESQKR